MRQIRYEGRIDDIPRPARMDAIRMRRVMGDDDGLTALRLRQSALQKSDGSPMPDDGLLGRKRAF